jgi:exodeoxyribonuclease VII large subunit
MTTLRKVDKHIYTVTELTRSIRAALEGEFPAVYVEGEVSNFVKHSSGHMYFSLKDANSVISCVLFKGVNQYLKFKMESGIKVVAFGRVSLYDKRGQYQLYVERVEPKGLGALQLAFEQLKERLRGEGLFDVAHKKEIPYLPHRIGVVTSPTGAAIKDILKVTRRRFQNIDLILNPVRVQGKGAELEIARAIEDLNKFGDVDVIIVGRGGGSLEDLWAFNEEIVARAIYNSEIPIISAVGHEIDVTIADFAADMRAATPSAAAETVIPEKEELAGRIDAARDRMKNALYGIVEQWETKLSHLCESYVFKQPFTMVEQYAQRVDDLAKGSALRIGHIIENRAASFGALTGRLESLSPFGVLKRGYSITTKGKKGAAIKDAGELKPGDTVKTKLNRGAFTSKVESVEGGN